MQFVVQFWQSVFRVDRSFRQVSDSSSFNNVSDGDSLDGLVLWHTSGTVDTSDWLDVTSTFLVSTVGSSLFWHFDCGENVSLCAEEGGWLIIFRVLKCQVVIRNRNQNQNRAH